MKNAVLFSIQMEHFPPTTAWRMPTIESKMEMSKARAACRSTGSASIEVDTFHSICHVLCITQTIRSPSQMICAITKFLSMKAVTFHIGGAQVMIEPTPTNDRQPLKSAAQEITWLLYRQPFRKTLLSKRAFMQIPHTAIGFILHSPGCVYAWCKI